MRRGYLQDVEIDLVSYLAREEYSVHRQVMADLFHHDFAETSAGGMGRPVADLIPADHDDIGLRATSENLHHGAHENVKAAIGFQITRDIGDHFVFGGQPDFVIGGADLHPGIWIGV